MDIGLAYWGRDMYDGSDWLFYGAHEDRGFFCIRDFFRGAERPGPGLQGAETDFLKQRNALAHQAAPLKDIAETYKLWRDRPFVVVGSGPSLEKDLDLIRDLVDRGAVVITWNRSYKIVGKAKIFFAFDRMILPEYWNWTDKHNCTLLTTPTAGGEVVDAKWKYMYGYRVPGEDGNMHEVKNSPKMKAWDWLEHGWITLTPVLHYCFKAGASAVYMTGCDHCWNVRQDEDKKYHLGPYYATYPDDVIQNGRHASGAVVKDSAGNYVGADPFNMRVAQFMECIIHFAERAGMPVYKTQDFGLLHCPVRPLTEVIP